MMEIDYEGNFLYLMVDGNYSVIFFRYGIGFSCSDLGYIKGFSHSVLGRSVLKSEE